MFGCKCKTSKEFHNNIKNKGQVNFDYYQDGQGLMQARAPGALPKIEL